MLNADARKGKNQLTDFIYLFPSPPVYILDVFPDHNNGLNSTSILIISLSLSLSYIKKKKKKHTNYIYTYIYVCMYVCMHKGHNSYYDTKKHIF